MAFSITFSIMRRSSVGLPVVSTAARCVATMSPLVGDPDPRGRLSAALMSGSSGHLGLLVGLSVLGAGEGEEALQ